MSALRFELPPALEAAEPPPVRDEVRLMVARPGRPLAHARFRDLPAHLRPGDLVVVNASATLPAALAATRADGTRFRNTEVLTFEGDQVRRAEVYFGWDLE